MIADYEPVIAATARITCAGYVELISEEPGAQMPKWFVSHAWQEVPWRSGRCGVQAGSPLDR